MAEPNVNTQSAAHETANTAGPVDGLAGNLTSAIASSGVGTLLCATRMRMGKDLQRVAEVLHIRYNYLVAIEDGRYEDLPGQAYAIGFVRSYAEFLGMDGNEVVRRYKEESAGVKRKVSFEFPIPTPDSGVPSGMLLLLAVVFGMSVYGIWYAVAGSDRSAVQLIQEVPSRLTALLNSNNTAPVVDVVEGADIEVVAADSANDPAPEVLAEGTTSSNSPAVTEENVVIEDTEELRAPPDTNNSALPAAPAEAPRSPAVSQVAEDRPVEDRNVEVAAVQRATPSPPPAPAAAPASKPAAASPEPAKPAAEEGAPSSPSAESRTPADEAGAEQNDTASNPPVEAGPEAEAEQIARAEDSAGTDVVELRAKTDSWIQLRDGEELLLTRLLRKGETFRVPERGGLTLMTGNAGGLEVLVNGKVMPPIGNEGTVARGVRLDPKRLQSGG